MRTKWFVLIGVIAALWSTPALAQSPPKVIQLDFKADVQADGMLANIQPDASLSPQLQAIVSKRVAQWRYRTGTWQGKPVPGKVSQRIVADVVPVASGSFAFRVKEVMTVPVFVDARRARAAPRMGPPRYPMEALVQGIEATLVYAIRRDAQGKPLEVEFVDAEVPDAWRRQFDVASLQAIKQWRLEPVEVDGQVIDCRLLAPITFRVGGGNVPASKADHDLRPYLPRFPDACPLKPVLETQAAGTLL